MTTETPSQRRAVLLIELHLAQHRKDEAYRHACAQIASGDGFGPSDVRDQFIVMDRAYRHPTYLEAVDQEQAAYADLVLFDAAVADQATAARSMPIVHIETVGTITGEESVAAIAAIEKHRAKAGKKAAQ